MAVVIIEAAMLGNPVGRLAVADAEARRSSGALPCLAVMVRQRDAVPARNDVLARTAYPPPCGPEGVRRVRCYAAAKLELKLKLEPDWRVAAPEDLGHKRLGKNCKVKGKLCTRAGRTASLQPGRAGSRRWGCRRTDVAWPIRPGARRSVGCARPPDGLQACRLRGSLGRPSCPLRRQAPGSARSCASRRERSARPSCRR